MIIDINNFDDSFWKRVNVMDLTYFQTFLEVVKCQSFTKAAEKLGYAQSSVTTQIQKLEQAYGVPLFERFGRGMRLTPAGEALWDIVKPMLELYAESKETIGQQVAGNLSIGTIESLAAFYLPPFLQKWQTQYPSKQISLHSVNETTLLDKVKEGEFDIGILLDRKAQSPLLKCITIREEPLVLVAKPDHPLKDIDKINLSHLDGQSLIVAEETCLYRTWFIRLLKQNGVDYRISFELGSLEAIKQCVLYGLGVALMPQIAVTEEVKRGNLIVLPFTHPDLKFYIQLVYHQKKWLSQSHLYLLELLRSGG
jgi:DNA-binding transcriptional LysR family regulator